MGKARDLARLIVNSSGAIDASNLGNAVPADGSITTAKLANDAVTAAKLASSGVTAGTYGSGSAIPAVTVDADGRITGISTNAVAASAPTTAQVLTATAGATAGDIGTYAFLGQIDTTNRTFGATASGSILYSASIGGIRWDSGSNIFTASTGTGGSARSGTWRLMGNSRVFDYSCATFYPVSLWLRIS